MPSPPVSPTVRMESGGLAELRRRYLRIQLDGDRRAALALVNNAIASGVSVDALQSEVVREAQREIGRLWEQDRVSVAQEHAATAISQVTLAHLYQHAHAEPRNGARVIVACVPGEHHDFPARLLADRLDLAGFETIYLGADVPEHALVDSVIAQRPLALALSITMPFNAPALRAVIRRVRAAGSRRVPIAVGGHACQWDKNLPSQVDADIDARDDATLIAALNGLRASAEAESQ